MRPDEYEETRALEESLALFEIQERDAASFPALPVSLKPRPVIFQNLS